MNLTPLIDVVFLLIVFFMLSTSFIVAESMELSIPSASARSVAPREVWVLRVRPDGKILSDKETFALAEFRREVNERVGVNPDQKILVLATEKASVQQLVSVLDIVYLSGARKVQIDHDASAAMSEVKLK